MKDRHKLNYNYVIDYIQSWAIPLVILLCVFIFSRDLRESDIKYPFIIGTFIVVGPSFFLFFNYLYKDWNKIVYINRSKIEIIKGDKTTTISKSNCKEVIRIESSYKDSKGYGGLFFLGGEFYYYQVIDGSGNKIEISCLVIKDSDFLQYHMKTKKVSFPEMRL